MQTARHHERRRPRSTTASAYAAMAIASALLSGCAAITNPTANGVPAHIVPPELLAPTREGFEPIDPSLLRQSPPDVYRLASGDILGVYVEGIIGNADNPPPVNLPDSAELPPAIGFPFPVRESGVVSLPFLGEISVDGLTVEEAEKKVIEAYLEKEILRPTDYRIIVTLMRPRHVRVLVAREDSAGGGVTIRSDSLFGLGTSQASVGGGRGATGQVVELPAYENDVLNALALTGGLPGLETTQEVLIYRGYWSGDDKDAPAADSLNDSLNEASRRKDGRVIRIPLRTPGGAAPAISRDDILLHNGDIVTIRARRPEFFYTGGLLPSSEQPLPIDYDLSVLEAVLRSRGLLLSGGLSSANFGGTVVPAGVGQPSPSQLAILRKAPNGQQVMIRVDLNEAIVDPRQNLLVQAEDVLILQENTDEAFTRYFSQTIRLDFFTRYLNSGSAQGTASFTGP
ncbi:MAG: polysaccharide biosynthesis/export family protein [Lacipirellulaceae bacterium]